MKERVYLDYNATTPLVSAAKDAMIGAMDVLGNPASVHQEGRQAKQIVERARRLVAEAVGTAPQNIIFTASATEAAALGLGQRAFRCAAIEHEAVLQNCDVSLCTDGGGRVELPEDLASCAVQRANSETGIMQQMPKGVGFCDATQAFGKTPLAFDWMGVDMAVISAHKIGGPKGVGALIVRSGIDVSAHIRGGGQESSRRSGTENTIGIAGFGAAAQAAQERLDDGTWERIKEFRIILENALETGIPQAIIVGKDACRLANTVMCLVEGWPAQTQVLQMDLQGFAISAGSACSSGKIRRSAVLGAMGFTDAQAGCSVRISLGPQNTQDEIERFVEAYVSTFKKYANCR